MLVSAVDTYRSRSVDVTAGLNQRLGDQRVTMIGTEHERRKVRLTDTDTHVSIIITAPPTHAKPRPQSKPRPHANTTQTSVIITALPTYTRACQYIRVI